jgi:hypothetical protein
MLRCEEVYGVQASDPDAVAERLGAVLEAQFVKHRSLYWGDYCLFRSAGEDAIRVYANHDPMYQPGADPAQERFFEPNFATCGVLVSAYMLVENLGRFRAGLRECFPEVVLIRDAGTD